MAGKKSKLDLSKPSQSIHSPFSGLTLSGLPEGPKTPEPKPSLSTPTPSSSKRGRVVLRKETAHRGGKTVLVIGDFDPSVQENEILVLAKDLRKACGCGGTVRNREIEIQGLLIEKIRNLLQENGFRVDGIRE